MRTTHTGKQLPLFRFFPQSTSFLAMFTSAMVVAVSAAFAQTTTATPSPDAVLPPPTAMVLDGVPPVSASIAARVNKYTEFRPTSFTGWHPTKREMLLSRRHKNTPQIYRLAAPGATAELLTDYPEPVRNASFNPKHGNYFIFGKDSGGNEVFRGFRRSLSGGDAVAITPDNKRVSSLAWSNSGKSMVYSTVPVGRQGSADTIKTELYIADPEMPEAARKVTELDGGGWFGFSFSPDDKKLLALQFISANESYLWLMDATTGKMQKLTDKDGGQPVSYSDANFSRNGRGLYVTTDRGSEFQRLNYIDLKTGKHTALTSDIAWDVASIDLSRDGKYIAVVINEDGNNVLRIMKTADHKWLPQPKLPLGTIGGMQWHRNSTDLAFNVTSATSPSEVYSVNIKSNAVTRWTTHEKMEVDAASFVEPELVRWKSFDGRMISGFLYRAPQTKFAGKRPVLVSIHGGPEAQFQPGFMGRNNYFTSEMGISILYPNVRGSSGYGKSFLKLDNGRLREDSVKDIGALFDWLATQPDLDASRIAVSGGSYGGYMSLAVASLYPERIAAAIDVVGISNFVTFLERTESYRRDLRRVEYGDERDPEMRKWMEEIAPLNRASRIKAPLFVIQGKNDPRVPWQEADQIVNTVKKNGGTVWYMLANDEGHGFAKKANADYQFYATIGFLRQTLAASAVKPTITNAALDKVLAGDHRSEANRTRDKYRNPKETLAFFGVKPDSVVVEALPGGGWYTEVLAPYLRERGSYTALWPAAAERGVKAHQDRLAARPTLYDRAKLAKVTTSSAPGAAPVIEGVAPSSADVVVTFRNVHNLINPDLVDVYMQAFFNMLKPGGVLGVVDHRAKSGTSVKAMIDSGYVTEDYVIKRALAAGFKLDAKSDVNNNPKDTKDYKSGVWTLPPTLTDKDVDRAKYLEIGESDRFTIRFVKPAK
jgi:dipeptidyl aminopeptidase/acylaminoacyl peptidase/predicted methyltransferase